MLKVVSMHCLLCREATTETGRPVSMPQRHEVCVCVCGGGEGGAWGGGSLHSNQLTCRAVDRDEVSFTDLNTVDTRYLGVLIHLCAIVNTETAHVSHA